MTDGTRAALAWLLICATVLAAIVAPFVLTGEWVASFADGVVARSGARWVVATLLGGLLAADVLLPVPSSFVATAAGASLGFWGGAITSFAGTTLGALIGYGIGVSVGAAGLRRLLDEVELDRARRIAARAGPAAIVLCRAIPVLAEATTLLAGASRMPFAPFAAAVCLANAGVSAAYAAVGAYAVGADAFLLAFLGAIAVPAATATALRGGGLRGERRRGPRPRERKERGADVNGSRRTPR